MLEDGVGLRRPWASPSAVGEEKNLVKLHVDNFS